MHPGTHRAKARGEDPREFFFNLLSPFFPPMSVPFLKPLLEP